MPCSTRSTHPRAKLFPFWKSIPSRSKQLATMAGSGEVDAGGSSHCRCSTADANCGWFFADAAPAARYWSSRARARAGSAPAASVADGGGGVGDSILTHV